MKKANWSSSYLHSNTVWQNAQQNADKSLKMCISATLTALFNVTLCLRSSNECTKVDDYPILNPCVHRFNVIIKTLHPIHPLVETHTPTRTLLFTLHADCMRLGKKDTFAASPEASASTLTDTSAFSIRRVILSNTKNALFMWCLFGFMLPFQ